MELKSLVSRPKVKYFINIGIFSVMLSYSPTVFAYEDEAMINQTELVEVVQDLEALPAAELLEDEPVNEEPLTGEDTSGIEQGIKESNDEAEETPKQEELSDEAEKTPKQEDLNEEEDSAQEEILKQEDSKEEAKTDQEETSKQEELDEEEESEQDKTPKQEDLNEEEKTEQEETPKQDDLELEEETDPETPLDGKPLPLEVEKEGEGAGNIEAPSKDAPHKEDSSEKQPEELPAELRNEIKRGTTAQEFMKHLIERGYQSVAIKDKEGNVYSKEEAIVHGSLIMIDGEEFIINFETYIPMAIPIEDTIPSLKMGSKMVTPPVIEQEDEELPIEEEETSSVDSLGHPVKKPTESSVNIKQYDEEQLDIFTSRSLPETSRNTPEVDVAVKADAVASIIAHIKTKVDTHIKEDHDKAFKIGYQTGQLNMQMKLSDWQVAKAELSKVHLEAKKLAKGNDLKQVGLILGKYQTIIKKLNEAKKYQEIVEVVSEAVVILKQKKVEEDIITEFVKKNIHSSKNVKTIRINLEDNHLKVSSLKNYQLELMMKEMQKVHIAGGRYETYQKVSK